MKRLLFLAVGLCFLLSSCVCTTNTKDTVFQASTIDALLVGMYDGDISCSRSLEHGNFGIGTFDCLDGEMVILDGCVYQIKADGKVYEPDPSIKTPFITVCEFDADKSTPVEKGATYETIEKLVDELAPNQNLFYAIKITGKFKSMRTRSVPGQHKPYPPLKKVTENQPEFSMENVSGTIVGFRCPPYVKGINVPGYHLHFISTDRTKGGHILSFELIEGRCEIDVLDKYFLKLPSNAEEFADIDLSKDRSTDLKDVEK